MRLRTHIVTDAVKTDANRDASAEIAAQVEEFLRRGGKIKEIPTGISGDPEVARLPPPNGKPLTKQVLDIRSKFYVSAKTLALHFGVSEAEIFKITNDEAVKNGRRRT